MRDLPQDLAAALKRAGLDDFFADCTNAHRRQYLEWIGEAKRPETRMARIEKAMQMLAEKRSQESARAKGKT